MKKKNKSPTYNMTITQIESMKEKSITEGINRGVTLAILIPLMVLRDEGWGEKRLNTFVEKFSDMYDSYNRGYLNLDDIKQTLKDEVGLEVRLKR